MAKQKSNMLRFGIISASVIVGTIIIIVVVYNLSMKPSKAKTEEIQKEGKAISVNISVIQFISSERFMTIWAI